MQTTIIRIIRAFQSKPKILLLTDALGALLSAFLLGFVLVRLQKLFGIPETILYILAYIPCFFAAFDLFSMTRANEHLGNYLKIIGGLNLFYCIISLGLVIAHSNSIEYLGWVYIISELIIVLSLARTEFYVSKKIKLAANIN